MRTQSALYPNLYIFLAARAGIGKTRAIFAADEFVRKVEGVFHGHTSMTMASLVDRLSEARCRIQRLAKGEGMLEYNSLYVVADELSAFMSEYDSGLIAGLTTFYDNVPYSQARRTNDIRIEIERPQLNILSGTTPSNLVRTMPEFAWEQGFTSRIILVYADDAPMIDIFNTPARDLPKDMIEDLQSINLLEGQFGWDETYSRAMSNWRDAGMKPVPDHPKLEHYCQRRFAHLMKLTMIANVDRDGHMVLTKDDFNVAINWLLEAEHYMRRIFESSQASPDTGAMDEIHHFVASFPEGCPEARLIGFARKKIPALYVLKTIDVMIFSGMIGVKTMDESTQLRTFIAMTQGRAQKVIPFKPTQH